MIIVRTNSRTFYSSVLQGAEDAMNPPKESWFRRNWRKIAGAAVGLIAGPVGLFLGPLLVEAIEGMLNGYVLEPLDPIDTDINYGTSDLISEYEASVLDSWFTNVFIPKYESFVKKANEIFITTNVETQVKLINQLNNELAVTKTYLSLENPKLSPLALETRNGICAELIYEVEKIIYKAIQESSVEYIAENVQITSTAAMLAPIVTFISFNAVATNYTLNSKVSYDDTADTLETVETVEVLDHVNNEIITTEENNSNTTGTTTTTTTTTETPKPKKSGLGLFAGLLFGTAVLIVAASDDDDKKKKPKQK